MVRSINFIIQALTVVVLLGLGSCEKSITVGTPKTQLLTNSVFANNSTATAAMTSVYSKMYNDLMPVYIPLFTGMSADELKNFSSYAPFVQTYTNSLSASGGTYEDIWGAAYAYIYQSNAVIEGLQNSSVISVKVKNQLAGEAKFIRAFWHFYLVNLFGDVPLITSTDYRKNAVATRTPEAQVYEQIIADLKDAQTLLNPEFVDASDTTVSTDRVRPTKWAATALLARVFLFKGDYTNAEAQSSVVINSGQFSLVSDLNKVFLKNSAEAIWQLMPVEAGYNTMEGFYFILTSAPSNGSGAQTTTLSNQLISAFEPNDNRKNNWMNSITVGSNTFYYPFKYKIATGSSVTENSMVLRLAEQYLIRSEANAQLNQLNESLVDLNRIRNRAGLPDTIINSKAALVNAILHERQVELFTEWGHRWLDLKRTGTIDAVMSTVTPTKGGTWETTDQLYPIPQGERNKDPNLSQNPGY